MLDRVAQDADVLAAQTRRNAQQATLGLRSRLSAHNGLAIEANNLPGFRVRPNVNQAALPVTNLVAHPFLLRAAAELLEVARPLRIKDCRLIELIAIDRAVLVQHLRPDGIHLIVAIHAGHRPLHHGLAVAVVDELIGTILH